MIKENKEFFIKKINKPSVLNEYSFLVQNSSNHCFRTLEKCEFALLDYSNFIRVIKENKAEFEKFQMWKDYLKISRNVKTFYKQCEICDVPTHILEKCPQTFYVPPYTKIISDSTYNIPNDRIHWYRNDNRKFKSIINQNLIAITGVTYAEQQGFIKNDTDLVNKLLGQGLYQDELFQNEQTDNSATNPSRYSRQQNQSQIIQVPQTPSSPKSYKSDEKQVEDEVQDTPEESIMVMASPLASNPRIQHKQPSQFSRKSQNNLLQTNISNIDKNDHTLTLQSQVSPAIHSTSILKLHSMLSPVPIINQSNNTSSQFRQRQTSQSKLSRVSNITNSQIYKVRHSGLLNDLSSIRINSHIDVPVETINVNQDVDIVLEYKDFFPFGNIQQVIQTYEQRRNKQLKLKGLQAVQNS